MENSTKIAVIGGTGKAGKYLVNQLINQGFHLKLLVRNPERFQVQSPLVEVIYGNVRDEDTVFRLAEGCQAIISTLGLGQPNSETDIFSQATAHVLRAVELGKTARYIVITGLNVDTPFDRKSPKTQGATDWMKTNFPLTTSDKQSEYELLSKSGLDWTLVRLPMIKQTDEKGDIMVSLEDCPGDTISATDLALFLIEQLSDKTYLRQAPFIATR
ncbi:MAG: NAD(P)H-binding protein [Spirosomataceae bacterium]